MQVPLILDFTTDTNYAAFTDLDGDGCSLTGSGPSTLTSMGTCWDVGAATLMLGAAGTVGSDSPLADIIFISELRNTVAGRSRRAARHAAIHPRSTSREPPPGASGRKRRAVEPPEKEAKQHTVPSHRRPREDEDAVRRQDQGRGVPEAVQRDRLGEDLAAVAVPQILPRLDDV